MTSKQRISLWRRVSKCFHHHEMEMIKQYKKENKIGPCQAHAYEVDEDERRMDIIGQNGNTGEHYDDPIDGRWNWYGDGDSDATSMDDDLPSAAEDCARQRGNYEI